MAAVPKPLHGRNFVFDGDPGLLFDGKQMLFVLRRPVHSAAARSAVSRKGQASAGRLPAGNTRVYLKRIEKPVSYTHLDVYKRQTWDAGHGLFKFGLCSPAAVYYK